MPCPFLSSAAKRAALDEAEHLRQQLHVLQSEIKAAHRQRDAVEHRAAQLEADHSAMAQEYRQVLVRNRSLELEHQAILERLARLEAGRLVPSPGPSSRDAGPPRRLPAAETEADDYSQDAVSERRSRAYAANTDNTVTDTGAPLVRTSHPLSSRALHEDEENLPPMHDERQPGSSERQQSAPISSTQNDDPDWAQPDPRSRSISMSQYDVERMVDTERQLRSDEELMLDPMAWRFEVTDALRRADTAVTKAMELKRQHEHLRMLAQSRHSHHAYAEEILEVEHQFHQARLAFDDAAFAYHRLLALEGKVRPVGDTGWTHRPWPPLPRMPELQDALGAARSLLEEASQQRDLETSQRLQRQQQRRGASRANPGSQTRREDPSMTESLAVQAPALHQPGRGSKAAAEARTEAHSKGTTPGADQPEASLTAGRAEGMGRADDQKHRLETEAAPALSSTGHRRSAEARASRATREAADVQQTPVMTHHLQVPGGGGGGRAADRSVTFAGEDTVYDISPNNQPGYTSFLPEEARGPRLVPRSQSDDDGDDGDGNVDHRGRRARQIATGLEHTPRDIGRLTEAGPTASSSPRPSASRADLARRPVPLRLDEGEYEDVAQAAASSAHTSLTSIGNDDDEDEGEGQGQGEEVGQSMTDRPHAAAKSREQLAGHRLSERRSEMSGQQPSRLPSSQQHQEVGHATASNRHNPSRSVPSHVRPASPATLDNPHEASAPDMSGSFAEVAARGGAPARGGMDRGDVALQALKSMAETSVAELSTSLLVLQQSVGSTPSKNGTLNALRREVLRREEVLESSADRLAASRSKLREALDRSFERTSTTMIYPTAPAPEELQRSVGPPVPRSPFGRSRVDHLADRNAALRSPRSPARMSTRSPRSPRSPGRYARSPRYWEASTEGTAGLADRDMLTTARNGSRSPFRPSRVGAGYDRDLGTGAPLNEFGGRSFRRRMGGGFDASMASLENAPRPPPAATSTPMVAATGTAGSDPSQADWDVSGLSEELDKALAAAEAVRRRTDRLNESLQQSLGPAALA